MKKKGKIEGKQKEKILELNGKKWKKKTQKWVLMKNKRANKVEI